VLLWIVTSFAVVVDLGDFNSLSVNTLFVLCVDFLFFVKAFVCLLLEIRPLLFLRNLCAVNLEVSYLMNCYLP